MVAGVFSPYFSCLKRSLYLLPNKPIVFFAFNLLDSGSGLDIIAGFAWVGASRLVNN
jgi:hypothetical protein